MCFCGLLPLFQPCDSGVLLFENSTWTSVFPDSVESAGMGGRFCVIPDSDLHLSSLIRPGLTAAFQ